MGHRGRQVRLATLEVLAAIAPRARSAAARARAPNAPGRGPAPRAPAAAAPACRPAPQRAPAHAAIPNNASAMTPRSRGAELRMGAEEQMQDSVGGAVVEDCASAIASATMSICNRVTHRRVGFVLHSSTFISLIAQRREPPAVFGLAMDPQPERQVVIIGRHPQLDPRIAVFVVDPPELGGDDCPAPSLDAFRRSAAGTGRYRRSACPSPAPQARWLSAADE